MASIIKKLAEDFNLLRRGELLYGRINNIYVILRFIRHIKNETNANLIEFLMQPKYDCLMVSAYASKKEPVSIREFSDFFELHYADFKTSLPTYHKGRLNVSLYPQDTLNMKARHVASFLNLLTDFLVRQDYSSSCIKCGSHDNLSPSEIGGIMLETCVNCQLKDAIL